MECWGCVLFGLFCCVEFTPKTRHVHACRFPKQLTRLSLRKVPCSECLLSLLHVACSHSADWVFT